MKRGLWKLLYPLLSTNNRARLVHVDETATYLWMQPRYGWAPVGEPVRCPGRPRATRYTLIAAIRTDGVIARKVIGRAMTYEDWRKFVEEELVPSLNVGDLVILDNLKIHYDSEALELVSEVGAGVLFQPPYSPETNPIEELFSKLKRKLRELGAKNASTLRTVIDEVLDSISADELHNYYGHAHHLVTEWSS